MNVGVGCTHACRSGPSCYQVRVEFSFDWACAGLEMVGVLNRRWKALQSTNWRYYQETEKEQRREGWV